jgi:hypothetical protein
MSCSVAGNGGTADTPDKPAPTEPSLYGSCRPAVKLLSRLEL